jgi:hypothetical protein
MKCPLLLYRNHHWSVPADFDKLSSIEFSENLFSNSWVVTSLQKTGRQYEANRVIVGTFPSEVAPKYIFM